MPKGRATLHNSGLMFGYVCAHEGNFTQLEGQNALGETVDNCNGLSVKKLPSTTLTITKYQVNYFFYPI